MGPRRDRCWGPRGGWSWRAGATRSCRVLRIVPAALLVAVGWLAHAGLGPLSVREGVAAAPAPASVTAALSAHQVSLLRLERALKIVEPQVTAVLSKEPGEEP